MSARMFITRIAMAASRGEADLVAEREVLALETALAAERAAREVAERDLAAALDVIAPFARYAEQHKHLDDGEGEIGEFYGPAFRVSISYRALRAVRDFAAALAPRTPGAAKTNENQDQGQSSDAKAARRDGGGDA